MYRRYFLKVHIDDEASIGSLKMAMEALAAIGSPHIRLDLDEIQVRDVEIHADTEFNLGREYVQTFAALDQELDSLGCKVTEINETVEEMGS